MNTTIKTLALILSVGCPAAFGAESFGVSLPAPFNTAYLFGVFVVAMTLLTLAMDYRPIRPLRTFAPRAFAPNTVAKPARTRLPLAA